MSGMYRPSPVRRLRLAAAASMLGALALLAAACGSTVPRDAGAGSDAPGAAPSSSVAGGNGATATGLPAGEAGLAVGDQSSSSPGPGGGGAAGASGAASAGTAAASGGRPGAPAAGGQQPAPAGSAAAPSAQDQAAAPPPASNAVAPSQSPGVTDTTVYLGVGFTRDRGATLAAAGVEGADPGDTRQYYDAVIDDLNARGGLAGRQVEPVYYEFSTTSTESAESQSQAACAHWTQDNSVFAILDGSSPIMQQCAHDAGALDIVGGSSSSTTDTFDRYPRYVEVTSIRLDRIGRVVVPGLQDLGYFDPGARIGIVTWDDERYVQAVETDFVPALARVGQEVAEVARIRPPPSAGAIGDTQASMSAAVLRFRAQGISHVMMLDGPAGFCAGGCISLLFLQTAEAQAYRPRYGFNSTNVQSNESRYLFAGAEGQLETAVGVIWYSSEETDEGVGPNPQRERCLALMAEHGINPGDDVVAKAFALLACDDLWFIEAAAAEAPVLEVDAFMVAVHGLGDRYRAASSFGSRFGPDQRDGAALVRNMVNDTECSCYRYPGPIYEPG